MSNAEKEAAGLLLLHPGQKQVSWGVEETNFYSRHAPFALEQLCLPPRNRLVTGENYNKNNTKFKEFQMLKW